MEVLAFENIQYKLSNDTNLWLKMYALSISSISNSGIRYTDVLSAETLIDRASTRLESVA